MGDKKNLAFFWLKILLNLNFVIQIFHQTFFWKYSKILIHSVLKCMLPKKTLFDSPRKCLTLQTGTFDSKILALRQNFLHKLQFNWRASEKRCAGKCVKNVFLSSKACKTKVIWIFKWHASRTFPSCGFYAQHSNQS